MTRPQLTDAQIEQRFLKKKPPAAMPATPNVSDLHDTAIDQDRFAADMALMRQQQGALVLAQTEQSERVTALARTLHYQGSTDLAVLENAARDAIRRIGMAAFELGGYLLLLKEGCDHGQFITVLEGLGVNYQSAKKYMAITRRFANGSTSTHLEKLGFSKMAELLPLDDDQVDDLVGEGQTGELALDDVARMSVRELRAAVRKERTETTKQKSQVERLTAVNTELHEEARLIKRLPADQALQKMCAEASGLALELQGRVAGTLRQAIITIRDAARASGDASAHDIFLGGLLGEVGHSLALLRDEFCLPEVGTVPEWQRWADASAAAAPDTLTPAAA